MTNPVCVRLATYAMCTRFELLLYGDSESHLRSAGEEAIAEIALADSLLNRFDPRSDISAVNRSAGGPGVVVDLRVADLIHRCLQYGAMLDGAFDISLASPMDRLRAGVTDLGTSYGLDHVTVDMVERTVRLDQPGMGLDLGGVGKGYAIERAVAVLREHGVRSAFVHGGTSSAYGIGRAPSGEPWRVAVAQTQSDQTFGLIDLAVSVSASHAVGSVCAHIVDPRVPAFVCKRRTAVSIGPDPVICEALSTVGVILGPRLTQGTAAFAGHDLVTS